VLTRDGSRTRYRERAVTEPELFRMLLLVVFALAGATFFMTGLIVAPYGRHARPGWGPTLPKRIGWAVMESPSVIAFLLVFLAGPRAGDPVPRIFAAMWLLHYVQRAWIDPLRMHGRLAPIPLAIVASAVTFNLLNSYLNARSLSAFGPTYGLRWLIDVRFLYGTLLFITGFVINRWADGVLVRMRRQNRGEYAIPRGGLYDDISCPNYFGEILQWTGFAIATWSLAGASFAVFTAANLVPRAVAHHRWYRRTFPDYPRRRTALIPGLL
jgi:3-oxo-5-alpha-steroid 4-dehydrogenase 1